METCLAPAPAAGTTPTSDGQTVDLLSAYLIDLIYQNYAIPAVMERMNHLHEWRFFAMTDDLDELYNFLDQYPARKERRKRFLAVRSFVRWLHKHSHIMADWTAGADLRRVAGNEL